MFRRKSSLKGMKGRMMGKAKRAVKRLLDKPTADRLAAVAMLATQENGPPFRPQPGTGLGDIGACKAVAETMKAVPDDLSIQTEGCRAVGALAERDEENVLRLGQAECCQLVERALEKFPNNSMLQTQGCRAVTNLFNGDGNSKQLVKGKACQLVVAALAKFPDDHEVQIEACGAIANLANNSKSNREMLSKMGACDLVAKSMSNFPNNIDVQNAACVAVGNLANRHPENKIRLGAAGACSKVCAALIAFKDDMGVQYMGCGAVGNLSSSNPENCTKLGEGGGCLLVAAAMNAFPTDRNLQHVGCAAVANLAIGNAENSKRLIRAGARVAVQRAMDKFKDDEEIQTRGSQALRWLNNRPRRSMSQSSPGHARLAAAEGKHERRATAYVPTGKPPTPVGERGRSITKLQRGNLASPHVQSKNPAGGPHGRSLSVPDPNAMMRRSRPSSFGDEDEPGESGPVQDRDAIRQPLPRSLAPGGRGFKPPAGVSKAQLEAMKRRSRSSVTDKDHGRHGGPGSTARKEAMKRRTKSLVTDAEYGFAGAVHVSHLEAPHRRTRSAAGDRREYPEAVMSTPKVEQMKRRSRSAGKDSPESPEELPLPQLEALKMRPRSSVSDKGRAPSHGATPSRGRSEVVKRTASSLTHEEVFPDSQSDQEMEDHSRNNVIAQARAALQAAEGASSRRSKSPAQQSDDVDFFDDTASEMSISDVHGESSEDVRAIPPPALPPAATARPLRRMKSAPAANTSRTPTSRASGPPLLPRRPAANSTTAATTQSSEQHVKETPAGGSDTDAEGNRDSPICRTYSATAGARADRDTRRYGVDGEEGAMMGSMRPGSNHVRARTGERQAGPGPDSTSFPASASLGHEKSKAPSRPDPSKPMRRSKSYELEPSADTLNRAGKDRGRSSNAGESLVSKVIPLEATATACSHWSSTASVSQPSSNGSAVGSSSAQEEKPGQLPRQLPLVTDDIDVGSAAGGPDGTDPDGAVVMRRSRHHTPRSGLGHSRSQHEDVPRRYRRSNSAESISRGRVCVSPASSMHDLGLEELGDNTSESSKSTGTYGSRRSSSRSTKSARRRRSLIDIVGDPIVTGAPKLAELVRTEESIISPLMLVLGEEPVAQSAMIRNVEQLLRRSHQMEAITARVLRDELMASTSTPGQKAMRSREYFNVVYTGLCGAHVASAVITRGGIVAESKDGWLRKASALLSVISIACPLVKPGVAMLGKALQLAERPQMADNLEQIAKGSKHTHEVSSVMELTARRLVEEDRAEIPKSSLDAHRSKSHPTNEWLPAWLLEEASACSHDERAQEGPPGTDSARKTGAADGCVILETLGRRGVRKLGTPEAKVDALVQAVLRKSVQWPSSTRSASPTGSFSKEDAAFRGASPSASQSRTSPIFYPPVSPTEVPSQRSMVSPSGSIVGASRRKAEATSVMAAARAVAIGSVPPAVQSRERHSGTAAGQEPAADLSAPKSKDDRARGDTKPNGVMEGDASAGAFGSRSDERTSGPASVESARNSKCDPSLAPAESRKDSWVIPEYVPPAWITERLGRVSNQEVSNKEVSQDTPPPAYRSESEPKEDPAKAEDGKEEEKKKKEPRPVVGKINVPEIFRRAEKALVSPQGSVKLRRAQSVSGNGKADSPGRKDPVAAKPKAGTTDDLVTPARPLRNLKGNQAATTGNAIARRGRARVSAAAPKPPPLDRSPSPATSVSSGNGRDADTRQAGSTKPSTAVRGSSKWGGVHKQSPGRRASPRIVNARGSTPRGSTPRGSTPRGSIPHAGTPKGGYSSGGTIKCSPRVPPVVKKSATRKASPRVSTAASGWLEEGRRTPAEARKGWGRSGSWYSPRPERVASQASSLGIAADVMASTPPLAAPSPAGGGHEGSTAMNFGSFDEGGAGEATALDSRKGVRDPVVEKQRDDAGYDLERDGHVSDGHDDDDDDDNLPPPSPPASLGTERSSRGSGVRSTKSREGDGEVWRRAPGDSGVELSSRDEGKHDREPREDADGNFDAEPRSREARIQHKKPTESNGEVVHRSPKDFVALRSSRSTEIERTGPCENNGEVAGRVPGNSGTQGNSRGTGAQDMKPVIEDDGEIARRVAELTKNGPDSIAPSPPGYEALCVAPAAGETFSRMRMSSRSPFNSEGAGSRRSIPRTPGSKPKPGSIAERIAGFGGALRSAYRRDHSLGSSRSSWSRSRGSSEGRGVRGGKQKEETQSPARLPERSRSLGRKTCHGERDSSPALNRLSNSSRLSNFLSGSKFTRAKTQPATGRDSFGSSVDETDDEDDVDEKDLSCPLDDRRSSYSSSRSSRRAKSLFGNNPNRGAGRTQGKAVAPQEKPAEERSGFHVKTNSVSDLIRRIERRGGRQDNGVTLRRSSTGQEAKSRWFLGGRK